MIELYISRTPNSRKISIMLEETGLPYKLNFVDTYKGEQYEPDFLAISPNNKVPAIVDHEPIGKQNEPFAIFESAAILTYLADKTGMFLAPHGAARYSGLAWLAWQGAGLGPMFGQLGFFFRKPERNEDALARFIPEGGRLLHVLEKRLAAVPYLAGAEYSIADIATYPWVSGVLTMFPQAFPEDARALPATALWLKAVGERPAVQRGMTLLTAPA